MTFNDRFCNSARGPKATWPDSGSRAQQTVRDEIVLSLVRSLLPSLSDVAGTDPWGVADLLTSATPALDGRRPIDVLLSDPREARRIAALIRAETCKHQAADPRLLRAGHLPCQGNNPNQLRTEPTMRMPVPTLNTAADDHCVIRRRVTVAIGP